MVHLTLPPKIKFSIENKLLVGVVGVLFFSLCLTVWITIRILTEEKRDEVWQQQFNEAVIYGKDIVHLGQKNFDQLRAVLTEFGPQKSSLGVEQGAFLKKTFEKQTDLKKIQIYSFNAVEQTLKLHLEIASKHTLPQVGALKPWIHREQWQALRTLGYAVVPVPSPLQQNWIAFVVADLKKLTPEGHLWLAVGLARLPDSNHFKYQSIKIVNDDGGVLFDSQPKKAGSVETLKDDPVFLKSQQIPVHSGTLEFKSPSSHVIASFYKPGLNFIILDQVDWNFAMQSVYSLAEKIILLGFAALGFAIIFALLISRQITRPIQSLSEASQKVSLGQFDLSLPVKSNDEISVLTHSFNVMSKKIGELIQERVHQAHLENELAIASRVQQTLIPPHRVQFPHVQMRSSYQAAEVCGGDWWGYFLKDEYICFAIADATGHGLPSALMTAAIRSCYGVIEETFIKNKKGSYSPSEIISIANKSIYDSSHGELMMTIFVGILNVQTGRLVYSSAGHNPPWLFKKKTDQEGSRYERISLIARGVRLGESLTVPPIEEKSVEVQSDDILFMFTDGLIEGKSLTGEVYSKSRLMRQIEPLPALGIDQMIEVLESEVARHHQGKTLDDDITMAALQFKEIATHVHTKGTV